MAGVELARAFITLVPSFEGAQNTITEQLLPQAGLLESAGAAGGGAASKFGGSFKKALAPLMGTAALAGAFKGLYSIGETFDAVADSIRVGTGASGEALDAMVESAKNVGKTVPTSFESAGQAIADWNTRMGLSGEALEKVAAQSEMLKSMGMEANINTLSAAFNAFKIEGDDVSGAMDTLFQVSQSTGVSMDTLAGTVQRSAPALQSLGFSFEESAAMAGLLDKAGLNSSQVMASMSKGLVTLAKDGEAPQDAFKRVTGEIQGFIDKGDEAGAIDLASKVFGTKGATQMISALKDSSLSLDDLVGSASLTGDTIMGVGAETQDFAEKWQIVKNNASAALEPLGSAVFDALGTALEWVLPYIESLGNWMAENQTVVAVIAGIIGGVLTTAFVMWAGSIVATNLALLASPITWIVIGIAALVAAIIALWQNWDTVWGAITSIFSAAWEWIKGIFDSFTSTISTIWNTVWQAVSDFVMGIWEGIKTGISTAIDFVWNIISTVLTTISTLWSNIWNRIKSLISGVWEGIKGIVSGAINAVWSTLSGVLSTISGLWSGAWNGIKSFVSTAWDNIKTAISNGISRVVDLVAGLPGKILSALGNLGSFLYDSGSALISGFVDGITAAFDWAYDAVKSGLDYIRSWFPFSPAKRGPFSGKGWVLYSGLSIGEGFAEGIRKSTAAVVGEASDLTSAAKKELDSFNQADFGASLAGKLNADLDVSSRFAAENTRLILSIEGREFPAYLREVAGGVVESSPAVQAVNGFMNNSHYSRMIGV